LWRQTDARTVGTTAFTQESNTTLVQLGDHRQIFPKDVVGDYIF
jgi:hypothetical protein